MFGAICGDILGSTCEYDIIKYDNPIEVPLFQESDTLLTNNSKIILQSRSAHFVDALRLPIYTCIYEEFRFFCNLKIRRDFRWMPSTRHCLPLGK